MPPELIVVGTGGLAKEAAQLARQIDPEGRRWRSVRYATHEPALLGEARPFGRIDLLDEDLAARSEPCEVVIGLGHPRPRRRLAERLRANPALAFPNLVHPRVEIDPGLVQMGIGNMVTQGVVMTCDIVIGDFNLLNWNVTVGHDSRIGSYNIVNPGSSVSGQVVIGHACLIGTGARILEGRSMADGTVLGAGGVLTRNADVPGGTYVGLPARLRAA